MIGISIGSELLHDTFVILKVIGKHFAEEKWAKINMPTFYKYSYEIQSHHVIFPTRARHVDFSVEWNIIKSRFTPNGDYKHLLAISYSSNKFSFKAQTFQFCLLMLGYFSPFLRRSSELIGFDFPNIL